MTSSPSRLLAGGGGTRAAVAIAGIGFAVAVALHALHYHPVGEDYFPFFYFDRATGAFDLAAWWGDFYGPFTMASGQLAYRPLTGTWWLAMHLAWGQAYPLHVVQGALLHALNAALVGWLALLLSGRAAIGRLAGAITLCAPWAIVVWGWPSASADLLCTTFLLLQACLVRRGATWRRAWIEWGIATPMMLAAALASKESALAHVGVAVLLRADLAWRGGGCDGRGADGGRADGGGADGGGSNSERGDRRRVVRVVAWRSLPSLGVLALYLAFRRLRFGSFLSLYPLDPGVQGLLEPHALWRGFHTFWELLFAVHGTLPHPFVPAVAGFVVAGALAVAMVAAAIILRRRDPAPIPLATLALLVAATLVAAFPHLPRLGRSHLLWAHLDAYAFMAFGAVLWACLLAPPRRDADGGRGDTAPSRAARIARHAALALVAVQATSLVVQAVAAQRPMAWSRATATWARSLPETADRPATYHVRNVPIYGDGWPLYRVQFVAVPPFASAVRLPDPIDPDWHGFIPLEPGLPLVSLSSVAPLVEPRRAVVRVRATLRAASPEADGGGEAGTPAVVAVFDPPVACQPGDLLVVEAAITPTHHPFTMGYATIVLNDEPLTDNALHVFFAPTHAIDHVFFPVAAMMEAAGGEPLRTARLELSPLGAHADEVTLAVRSVFVIPWPTGRERVTDGMAAEGAAASALIAPPR